MRLLCLCQVFLGKVSKVLNLFSKLADWNARCTIQIDACLRNSMRLVQQLFKNLSIWPHLNQTFRTTLNTFLRYKKHLINTIQLSYSNARLEATNKLIKDIKANAFGFRNLNNFKKRIFLILNITKEKTKRSSFDCHYKSPTTVDTSHL